MLYEIPQSSRDVPGLEDYLRAIRERWQIIALLAIVGTVLALLFANTREDVFESEAKVVINPTIVNSTNTNLVSPRLEREREVMQSVAVIEQALVSAGIPKTPAAVVEDLEVTFVNNSDTLAVAYQSTDASEAAVVANEIAAAYVARREAASIAVYESEISSLEAQAAALDESLGEISTELGAAQADRLAATARAFDDPARQGLIEAATESISALTARRNSVTNDLGQINRDLRESQRALTSRAVTAEVIQAAESDDAPVGLGRNLLLAAGFILGALAGAALAFTLDRLDRTAKGATEIESALGANVLGSVPSFGIGNRRSGVVMLSNAKNSKMQRARESYRRLRASLSFLQSAENKKSFIITSARPGEGKSVTAANVAVAAAQAGSRVALVSADLRRPMIEKLLNIRAEVGLADHLRDPTITGIVQAVPDVNGLVVVPSGPLPHNPGELLASPRFGNLVNQLRDQFDTVIIDMPPVLATADAGAVAPSVDGVLVVVDGQSTDTNELMRVRASLERAGANIVGAVLNRDSSDSGVSLRKDRYAYERVAGQR